MNDVLTPKFYKIKSIVQDTPDVFTLALDKEAPFLPGQFNMLYSFGIGEAAISISSDPDSTELRHTIRAVGSVTNSLQKLQAGDEIGVRGPFGTHWPLEKWQGDVLVIAGGIGLAALKSALHVLAGSKQKSALLYGTRKAEDILYKKEMEEWKKQGIEIEVTLDFAEPAWKGRVGVVTSLIARHLPRPKNTLVLICGPEIMIHFALHELLGAGAEENNIYISMERNMQCAAGFCGHCQYGPYFLCKDGPVFSYPQIKNFLKIKEL